jgi:hypothetical protein
VRIALRHRESLVSEEFRDGSEWYSLLTQATGERVSAIMPAERLDARRSHGWDKPVGVITQRLSADVAHHASVAVATGTKNSKSTQRILIQRERNLFTVFYARDGEGATDRVNIFPTKLRYMLLRRRPVAMAKSSFFSSSAVRNRTRLLFSVCLRTLR